MKIAVTTDFTDFSKKAFEPAVTIAKKFGADLTLFHQGYSSIYTPMENEAYFDELENHLIELAQSTPEFGEGGVSAQLARSDYVMTLDKILEDYDLVVTATHGRTGLKHFTLGSYAEKLVRMSPCDVLVARPKEGPFQPKKILVAHDFTNTDSHTLKSAYEWAKALSAEIDFLTVVDTWTGTFPTEGGFDFSWTEIFDQAKRDAVSKLEGAIDKEPWQDLVTHTKVLEGNPAEVIIEESKNYDLIVIGKHNQSAVEHFFLGSVAEKVIRRAECSVLVVEHPEGK